MTNQRVKRIENILIDSSVTWLDPGGFDSGIFFGLGIGYQFNNWLRADITGEYRGKVGFHALDRAPNGASPTGFQSNDYTATKSEWVFLANGYVDLGTWWCLTPFVGAGVGFARNTIDHYRDVNVPMAGVAYADSATKWNFAWALHAGVAYKATPGFTVELAYRYLNLGDAVTGDVITYTGVNAINNPTTFKNIDSHDVKLGVRWNLQPEAPMMPPPLVRKG
jgi:opacity protein-like surface antigen